jgi:lincosamide nucleotidyltransferase A/C/D/E
MVSAEDVIHIYQLLSANGVPAWLTGGWGIDALLGEQTRPHKDLDVLVRLEDVGRLNELLGAQGYGLKELWSENRWVDDGRGNPIATAFVLQDGEGRQVDAHALRFDERGEGVPAWDAPEGFLFRRRDLSGVGWIAGLAVCCIDPEMQAACHTGYALPEIQVQDLARLQERFGIELPAASSPAGQPED